MNSITLFGRLTRDVEVKKVGESNIANFTLAVRRDFIKEGGQETDFINCFCWGKQAEILEKYVKKGEQLIINGSLQIDTVEDDMGTKKYYTKVKVNKFSFCGQSKSDDDSDENLDKLVEKLPFD